MQAAREHYGHDTRQESTLWVKFERSEITLDIPEKGLVTKEGWRVTPLTAPIVSETFYWYIPPSPITINPQTAKNYNDIHAFHGYHSFQFY